MAVKAEQGQAGLADWPDDLRTVNGVRYIGKHTNAVLSALRLHMADAMNIPREGHALLWVVNFPMFRYDEDEKKYAAEHHPFTHVLKEDLDKIESDPLACGSYSYDLVMDGFEVGGGTIRIHNAEEQRRILRVVGLTDDEIDEKFGHLIRALELGAARRHRAGLGSPRDASGPQGLHPRRHRLPEDEQRERPHDGRSECRHRPPAEGREPAHPVSFGYWPLRGRPRCGRPFSF